MTGPHPCPFVRAVVAGDEAEIRRLNEADGEPAVLLLLRGWALQAVDGVGAGAEIDRLARPFPEAHRAAVPAAIRARRMTPV